MQLHRLRRDLPAEELLSLLRKEAGDPLQVMAGPSDPIIPVLLAGGFQHGRRCYEMEVTQADLAGPVEARVPLTACSKGLRLYDACCGELYSYYRGTHETASPLTASEAAFFSGLPKNAVCQTRNGKILHFAFVEGSEIAYVGTAELRSFSCFA